MTDDKVKDGPRREPEVTVSDQTIHDAMRRQIMEILDDADLTEEQRQQILISMSCPCCGAAGMSMTIPLKPIGDGPVF